MKIEFEPENRSANGLSSYALLNRVLSDVFILVRRIMASSGFTNMGTTTPAKLGKNEEDDLTGRAEYVRVGDECGDISHDNQVAVALVVLNEWTQLAAYVACWRRLVRGRSPWHPCPPSLIPRVRVHRDMIGHEVRLFCTQLIPGLVVCLLDGRGGGHGINGMRMSDGLSLGRLLDPAVAVAAQTIRHKVDDPGDMPNVERIFPQYHVPSRQFRASPPPPCSGTGVPCCPSRI